MAAHDLISAAKEKVASILAPIGGGVGADVTYDETFEAMKGEIDKLASMSGGKVDWGSVASRGEEILAERSKDFRVVLYYAAARAQLDGMQGVLEGLIAIQELMAAFWEPMYPALRRPKARGNLAGWYGEVTAPVVEAFRPGASDEDLCAAVDEVSKAVDAELRDKLGDAYPGMGALRENVRRVRQSVPKPLAAAPPPPPPPAPVARPEPAAPAPVAAFSETPAQPSIASITDASSALSVVSECGLLLARAGDALRAADPADPQAYRLGRIGFWLELTQTPPSESGVTLVPPPPDGLRERFDGLAASEDWLGLIHAADEVAAEYLLWLDPHRYVANAMDRLGALFLDAKKALLREMAVLLLRIPTLPTLSFNDGTPLADGQTKMWLESEVGAILGSGGGGGGGGAAVSALDEPMKEARALAASGRLDEAIEVVARAAASAPSPADRFRGRLCVAKLCLHAEQFAIARGMLEALDRTAREHKLADWEPDLCADLYAALYAANRGINRGTEPGPEARAREEAAFEMLCALDAGAALKLATSFG